MNVLVLDCETTGVDPEKDAVVEIAGAVVDVGRRRVVEQFDYLVNPHMLIPPQAMAIHHILDRQVVEAPPVDQIMRRHILPLLPRVVPCAHNAEFDKSFLLVPGDWICTWRCAQHRWPDAPSFSNQTLRYHLDLFREPEPKAMPPHRATADVWVTVHVLIKLLETADVSALLDLTKEPILQRTVRFGKHRGEEWSKVPRDYLRWILKAGDFDRDVMHTARHYA